MKKKYEKPQVRMERFALSQHIASCEWDFEGLLSAESCRAASNLDGLEGWALFANTNNGCTEILDPKVYEGYCVFAGKTDWGVTFNS